MQVFCKLAFHFWGGPSVFWRLPTCPLRRPVRSLQFVNGWVGKNTAPYRQLWPDPSIVVTVNWLEGFYCQRILFWPQRANPAPSLLSPRRPWPALFHVVYNYFSDPISMTSLIPRCVQLFFRSNLHTQRRNMQWLDRLLVLAFRFINNLETKPGPACVSQ